MKRYTTRDRTTMSLITFKLWNPPLPGHLLRPWTWIGPGNLCTFCKICKENTVFW